MRTGKTSSSHQARTLETPVSPNTVDAITGTDVSSYFLIHQNTGEYPNLSPNLSRSRARNYPKSLQSQISQPFHMSNESEESNKSKHGRGNSFTSSVSFATRLRNVDEWNDRNNTSDHSPASYDQYTMRHPADPPRPPREGCEWVWFPEGYWAEREFQGPGSAPRKNIEARNAKQKWWDRKSSEFMKKSKSKSGVSKRTRSCEQASPIRTIDVPKIKIGSILIPETRSGSVKTRKSSKISKSSKTSSRKVGIGFFGLQFMRQPSAEPAEEQDEALGLYCKTKKQIKHRLGPKEKSGLDDAPVDLAKDSADLASHTATVLEGASKYFDKQQKERKRLRPKAQFSAATPQTIGSPPKYRRTYGLAPWHRKNSHESFLSVSSSVHNLLMGKTPVATPVGEPKYEGHEEKECKVDISSAHSHALSFLPSEAIRVKTPLVSPGMPNIQARGFFFDLNAPKDDTDSETHSATLSTRSASTAPRNKDGTLTPRLWWEGDAKHVTSTKSTHSSLDQGSLGGMSPGISQFELNTPEHLPSSPLCPRSSKHASGGTGICVYHGRRRSGRLKHLKKANTGSSSGIGEGK